MFYLRTARLSILHFVLNKKRSSVRLPVAEYDGDICKITRFNGYIDHPSNQKTVEHRLSESVGSKSIRITILTDN